MIDDSLVLLWTVQGDAAESTSRRKEFEAWLSKQSDLLSTVLSARMSRLSTEELMVQQDRLKELRAGLGWGQQQFQLLLQESPAREAVAATAGGQAEDVCLEELRYRWMLHKSKLKDVRELGSRKRSKVGCVVMTAVATRWQSKATLPSF